MTRTSAELDFGVIHCHGIAAIEAMAAENAALRSRLSDAGQDVGSNPILSPGASRSRVQPLGRCGCRCPSSRNTQRIIRRYRMNQRRKVLKGLGVSVPAVWTATVVQTVSLPVHAQTSQQETTSGCSALAIPGTTVSCPVATGSGITNSYTDYRIDDSGSCPVLSQTTASEFPDSDDVLQVRVFTCESCTTLDDSRVLIQVRTNGPFRSLGVACGATATTTQSGPLTFESSSGVTYQADFTITGTIDAEGNSVTVSDITLTPIS